MTYDADDYDGLLYALAIIRSANDQDTIRYPLRFSDLSELLETDSANLVLLRYMLYLGILIRTDRGIFAKNDW